MADDVSPAQFFRDNPKVSNPKVTRGAIALASAALPVLALSWVAGNSPWVLFVLSTVIWLAVLGNIRNWSMLLRGGHSSVYLALERKWFSRQAGWIPLGAFILTELILLFDTIPSQLPGPLHNVPVSAFLQLILALGWISKLVMYQRIDALVEKVQNDLHPTPPSEQP